MQKRIHLAGPDAQKIADELLLAHGTFNDAPIDGCAAGTLFLSIRHEPSQRGEVNLIAEWSELAGSGRRSDHSKVIEAAKTV